MIALVMCFACATSRPTEEPTASVEPRYTPVVPAPEPEPVVEPPATVVDKNESTPATEPEPVPVQETVTPPTSTPPAPPPAPPPEDAAIVTLLEAYYADFGARNWAPFAAHFWPGATIATIRKPVGAQRETVVVTVVDEYVRDARARETNAAPITVKFTARDVRIEGIVAQALARFDASVKTEGGEIHTWHGVDAFTLVQHDGVWRISALAVGSSPVGD